MYVGERFYVICDSSDIELPTIILEIIFNIR